MSGMSMMAIKGVCLAGVLLGAARAQDNVPEWVQPPADEATGQICHLQCVNAVAWAWLIVRCLRSCWVAVPRRYLHHGHARPVDLSGTQCSAWSDNSCCSSETAAAYAYDQADAATGLYDGHGMGISQCGIPSTACQKWFIAEGCLYECDVNAGRYRHHVGDAACEDDNNNWQMSGFPLKVFLAPLPRLVVDCWPPTAPIPGVAALFGYIWTNPYTQ